MYKVEIDKQIWIYEHRWYCSVERPSQPGDVRYRFEMTVKQERAFLPGDVYMENPVWGKPYLSSSSFGVEAGEDYKAFKALTNKVDEIMVEQMQLVGRPFDINDK